MPDPSRPSGLPRLAYVYTVNWFSAMDVAAAADGVCELVWLVDGTTQDLGAMAHLLRRIGPIVDVGGMDDARAARAVAACGIQGILCLADDALVWTARVARRLGLPHVAPDVAERLTDKFQQRRAFVRAGLRAPRSWAVTGRDLGAVDAIGAEATFPVVLKPRHGGGSRDTLPAASPAELRRLVERLVRDPAADGIDEELVVEEYIPDVAAPLAGDGFANYVSVESVVSGGRIGHLSVTGRMPPAEPFRETGFYVPCSLPDDLRDEVVGLAEAAAAALGVTLGCLHTEIKLTPDGPVVIEVNGRVGGGMSEILEVASGVPFLHLAFRCALGEDVVVERMPECRRVGFLLYVQAPAHCEKMVGVEGLDRLRRMDGIEQVVLNRAPGQALSWRDGNHGYVYSVLGTVPDHRALLDFVDGLGEIVHIEAE